MDESGECCTRCGAILDAGASACPRCGHPTVVVATCLALRHETGPSAGTLRLLVGAEAVGRRTECSIRLGSATVSGRHATLEPRDGEWILTDCGSTNGTFVDGRRLTAPVALRPGMSIAFGEERVNVIAVPPETPATPRPQVATPPPPPPPSPAVPTPPSPPPAAGPPPPPPPPSPVPAWPVGPRMPTASRRRGPLIAVAALVATAAVVAMALVGWHLLTSPKVLATTTIAPEEAGGRVEVPGEVAVTIPIGALARPVAGSTEARPLERPTRLEIVEVAPPASPDDRLQVLSAYDIRLADELLITQPLEIEIAYDPAAVPAGRDPRHALLAAWYNPLTGTWGVVPAVVDPAAHRVTLHATHLSVYGLILQWWEDVAETEHFTLCYDRAAILADVYAGEQAWTSKTRAEGGRDPLGPRQGPSAAGVPTFIQDLGRMLEHSYRRYQLAGFRVPPTTWGRLTVFVYPSGYSQRSKLTGVIDITTIFPSPAEYRLMTAHELFHAVEAEYYQSWLPGYSKVGEMMAMNYRTWWLEASAEYAAWQIAWGGECAVALPQPKYLEDPLSLEGGAASPQHMYQNAWFLKELTDHGVKFRELFEYLVDRTSAAFGMEAIGALNFTLNQLGVNRGPSEEWKHTVTLDRLEDYFLEHKPELVDRYRAFAAKLLFDTASPMAGVTSGDDLLTKVASEASLFNAAQTADERTLIPPGDYACRLWGIRVATAPRTASRRLRVFVDQELPTGTGVDVFVLRGNARRPGGVRPVGTMASSNITREVPVTVADGDAVYCLVFNRGSEPRSITVKIDTGVRLQLSSPAIPNGLPRRLYPFTADAENIPPEVRSTLLVWDFGDGSEPAEERRSGGGSAVSFTYRHAYGEERAFTLTARLFDTTRGFPTLLAEATARVTIAEELALRVDPPTIVAEPGDDVSFAALASGAPADPQYRWTFGDGSAEVISRSQEVVHRYAATGEFSVRVVLLDTSRPPSERELAAAEATAVIREAGPVAVLAMRVMLHTGRSTEMRRIVGSDTTYMSFDYDQEWEFSRVEAQGLEFWASATTTQDDWRIRRTLKGRLTPDRKAVERLELEEVRTKQDDTVTTTSRDRLLLRDVPSVRQKLDRVVCEVTGPSTAGHVAVVEASYEVASPTVVGTRFELDPHDIDWQALDRSLSLTEPRPAFVRIEIIPQR